MRLTQEEYYEVFIADARQRVRTAIRNRGVNQGLLTAVSAQICAMVNWRAAGDLAAFRNRKR